MNDRWRDTYDQWKLATPPEYDEPEDEEEPMRCRDCGALTNDDGYSIDARCCIYCRAD